jgi:hypothetical protein
MFCSRIFEKFLLHSRFLCGRKFLAKLDSFATVFMRRFRQSRVGPLGTHKTCRLNLWETPRDSI